jgi:hypothetical protein
MTIMNIRHRSGARAARYATFCLFGLLAVLCLPNQTHAQWATSGTNTTTTNNVGVGTTTPEGILDVGNADIRLRVTTTDTTDKYGLRVAETGRKMVISSERGGTHQALVFGDTGLNNVFGIGTSVDSGATWNSRFVVSQGGNVGIGTSAPLSKLHVAGDVRVDGNISAKYQDVAEWVPSAQKLDAGMVVILDTARDNHVTASSTPYDTRVAGVVSAQPGLSLGEAGEGKALVATTGRVKVKVDATRAPIKIGDLLVTSEVAGVAMRSQPLELGGVQLHRPGTLIGKALQSLDKGTGEILVLLSLQ